MLRVNPAKGMVILMRIKVLCIVVLAVMLGGCMDYHETNQMSIVSGIAVDIAEEGGYSFCFEIIDTTNMDLEDNIRTSVVRTSGNTLAEAAAKTSGMVYNQLYFGNADLMIVGEEAARNGAVAELVREIFSKFKIRDTVSVVIARGNQAQAFFDSENTESQIISYEVSRHLQLGHIGSSILSVRKVYELYNRLEQHGSDGLLIPAFSLNQGNKVLMPVENGAAVFNGDSLTGFIDSEYIQDMMMVSDGIRPGTSYITPEAVFTLRSCSSKLSYQYENGLLNIYADIFVTAGLSSPANLDSAISRTAEQVMRERVAFIYREMVHDYGADVLGIGRVIYQCDPKLWEELQPVWGEVLRRSELVVRSKFDVRN